MVNVQLATKIRFGNAATLTRKVVTLSRFPALFTPVFAIVRIVAAFPSRVALTNHNGQVGVFWRVFFLPSGLAFNIAELAPSFSHFVGGCQKCVMAMFASTFNLCVSRVIFAVNVFTLPFTKARLRTKALFGVSVMNDGAAALFAMHFWQFNNAEILLGISRRGTFTAAINTWPGSMIPEHLATSGASGIYSAVSFLAISTTKTGVLLVVLKNSMTILASGLHKKAPPVAMPNGLFA